MTGPAERRRPGGVRGWHPSRWVAMAVTIALVVAMAGCTANRSGGDVAADGTGVTVNDVPRSFGTLASPCGPAQGDLTAGQDQGVTADSVTIGYGDDAGYQGAPGLDREMSEAVQVMIDWCNAQGGINGRHVTGNYYDGRVLEATNAMTEACGEVFMMVGQGFVLDGGAEQTRVGCKLPQVPGFTVSGPASNGPWSYAPVPSPVDFMPSGSADLFAQAHPDAASKAGLLYADFPADVDVANRVKTAYPEWGWTFLDGCELTYPIAGVAQWAPYVQRLRDCGAEVVYYIGAPLPDLQNLLDAAALAGYRPYVMSETNLYSRQFANANGSGNADNVHIRMAFVPFDQADPGSATDTYVKLVTAAGFGPAQLGAQAASAFLLWATAAKSCGSDLTRACVLDALSRIHEWTGGGLHSVTDPGANLPSPCEKLMRLQGSTFVPVLPEDPSEFACNPDYVVDVSGVPAAAEAKLDAERTSTAYTSGS